MARAKGLGRRVSQSTVSVPLAQVGYCSRERCRRAGDRRVRHPRRARSRCARPCLRSAASAESCGRACERPAERYRSGTLARCPAECRQGAPPRSRKSPGWRRPLLPAPDHGVSMIARRSRGALRTSAPVVPGPPPKLRRAVRRSLDFRWFWLAPKPTRLCGGPFDSIKETDAADEIAVKLPKSRTSGSGAQRSQVGMYLHHRLAIHDQG